jgi:hypothetical protein
LIHRPLPDAILRLAPVFKLLQTGGCTDGGHRSGEFFSTAGAIQRIGTRQDRNPTWYGHSIGKWDGDTLVVDTIGFNVFRQFGFWLRKPRPLIAKANPSLQKVHKKNSGN